jgi:predicted alpha/beta-fold hydrolase
MKLRNRQKLTTMQVAIIAIFSVLDKLSSKVAGYFLYTIWLMPGLKKKKHDRVLPETSEQFWLRVRDKRIAYWVSGTGPTVLFVHGWGSYGAQFSKMINAFYSAGYQVIWFDAPAHGLSSGWQTNIFEIQECISSLQAKYGHFEMVIGH